MYAPILVGVAPVSVRGSGAMYYPRRYAIVSSLLRNPYVISLFSLIIIIQPSRSLFTNLLRTC
eukprot:SAG11_NODE_2247_length_3636_cov_3.037037_2_plen_63_part_00